MRENKRGKKKWRHSGSRANYVPSFPCLQSKARAKLKMGGGRKLRKALRVVRINLKLGGLLRKQNCELRQSCELRQGEKEYT